MSNGRFTSSNTQTFSSSAELPLEAEFSLDAQSTSRRRTEAKDKRDAIEDASDDEHNDERDSEDESDSDSSSDSDSDDDEAASSSNSDTEPKPRIRRRGVDGKDNDSSSSSNDSSDNEEVDEPVDERSAHMDDSVDKNNRSSMLPAVHNSPLPSIVAAGQSSLGWASPAPAGFEERSGPPKPKKRKLDETGTKEKSDKTPAGVSKKWVAYSSFVKQEMSNVVEEGMFVVFYEVVPINSLC